MMLRTVGVLVVGDTETLGVRVGETVGAITRGVEENLCLMVGPLDDCCVGDQLGRKLGDLAGSPVVGVGVGLRISTAVAWSEG